MIQRCTARDIVAVSKREITQQGYLVAPAVIGRTGVQSYTRGELGLDGDPNAVLRLMRTADEVFRPETVSSFENAPVTDGHPKSGVTADNWASLAKGEVRDISPQDKSLLGGRTIIKDGPMVAKVSGGKGALSCGYSFDLDLTPGEGFDGYQRNILGDHVAIVDVPRGGPVCRIGDEGKEQHMSVRALAVDGLPRFELESTVADAVEIRFKALASDRDQVIADFSEAVDSHKKSTAAKDAEIKDAKAAVVAKDAELVKAKADLAKAQSIDVDALVIERTKTIDGAKKLAPEMEIKGSTSDIRKAAIVAACGDELNKIFCAAIFGDDGIEKADDAKIKGAFSTLLALPRQRELSAQDANMARTLTGDSSAVFGGGEVIGDDDQSVESDA